MLMVGFAVMVIGLITSPIIVVAAGAASGIKERRKINRICRSYDATMAEIMRCTSR